MIPFNPFLGLFFGGGTAIGDAAAARMRLSCERAREANARVPDALEPVQPEASAPATAVTPAGLLSR